MPKRTTFCPLLVVLGFCAIAAAEDFRFDRPRPLMALSAVLEEKYGLPVTYEDAPFDSDSELEGQIIPRNGNTVQTPKWKPITFRVLPGLPTRPDPTLPLSGPVDPKQSLAAVQELVNQYNKSGNPGRFTVLADGKYLHIEQIERKVNGKLQAFQPVSTIGLSLDPQSGTCQQVLSALSAALWQVRGVSIAQGNLPGSALLAHQCKIEGGSLTVGQALASLIDGLELSPVTGKKLLTYVWDLVYDLNWNKYFLSITWVMYTNPISASETVAGPQVPAADQPPQPGQSRADKRVKQN